MPPAQGRPCTQTGRCAGAEVSRQLGVAKGALGQSLGLHAGGRAAQGLPCTSRVRPLRLGVPQPSAPGRPAVLSEKHTGLPGPQAWAWEGTLCQGDGSHRDPGHWQPRARA